MDLSSTNNIILGRHTINAIISTYYLKMKFPIGEGVGEVKGKHDMKIPKADSKGKSPSSQSTEAKTRWALHP